MPRAGSHAAGGCPRPWPGASAAPPGARAADSVRAIGRTAADAAARRMTRLVVVRRAGAALTSVLTDFPRGSGATFPGRELRQRLAARQPQMNRPTPAAMRKLTPALMIGLLSRLGPYYCDELRRRPRSLPAGHPAPGCWPWHCRAAARGSCDAGRCPSLFGAQGRDDRMGAWRVVGTVWLCGVKRAAGQARGFAPAVSEGRLPLVRPVLRRGRPGP